MISNEKMKELARRATEGETGVDKATCERVKERVEALGLERGDEILVLKSSVWMLNNK